MKTFQIAHFVAALSFLKPTAVDGRFFSCGITNIEDENVADVAGNLWTYKLGQFQSDSQGSFPQKVGNSEYGELRKFPLLYGGNHWDHGSFMYYVISNKNGDYIKLYYTSTNGDVECDIYGP
ncbi:BgTH12-01962 [Blumeria graminis f. sp. triticale]|uniref:BgtE-20026 n=3 Tax=Blumeria graminis TaxID=34373 RepID=A0A381LHW6_BLUGR|nr:BgTH12-01961 [Blumeria graminis f. sp. triticale]CAD6501712.1 BgTH12-01962 [Blumeria graminis f. sp. triticale]VDB84355.1 BgtE-20026 [Blumeria graminis f. sp. tritici]